MPVPRQSAYIWATWLPRLVTGENSCEWAAWFKAHYQDWTRTPSEFNQAEWMLNHTALLNKRKANWKHGGFDVNIEGQNSFQLPASRQIGNAGGPARPDHAAGRPSGHRSREDRAGQRQSRRLGDDLPVRHPESAGTVPDSQTQRAGHLRGPHGPHTGAGGGRPVHTEPGSIDPPTGGRQAARPSAEQTGMPVL